MNYEQNRIGLSLFDLDNDVAESTNVYDKYPDVVKSLEQAADAARKDLGDRLTKSKGTGARAAGKLRADEPKLPLVWK